MNLNILKKDNSPVVDMSLETTRNIEFQLLNMKKELENVTEEDAVNNNLFPAVSDTLSTLQQIESQLESLQSLLESYGAQHETNENRNDELKEAETPISKQDEPPFPPERPSHFPGRPFHSGSDPEPFYEDTYPNYYEYPPYYPQHPPNLQPPPEYGYPADPYRYYYPPYPIQPPYGYGPYFRNPPTGPEPPYPPTHPPTYPPVYGLPPQYGETYQDERVYRSSKYPTVASSGPAYSSKVRAVPPRTFSVAYYPWQQFTGVRMPMDSRVPYMNIYDSGREYLVFVELPGVERENLELRVDGQSIWITGKPTIIGDERGIPMVQEHGFHEFYRQVSLPSRVLSEQTTCTFDNGILKIKLIKTNSKPSTFKVKIK